jgi:hypothetical protein
MRASVLRRLLQNALTLSISAPLVSLGACGGRTSDDAATAGDSGPADAGQLDAHTRDGGVIYTGGPDASMSCAGQGCGGECAVGCTLTTACVADVLQCNCACPPQEASVIDVVQPDATDPCHPSPNQCPYYLPLSCIDGAVPDASSPTTQECAALCGFPNNGSGWCNVGPDPAGQPAVECYANCGLGRRTPELGAAPCRRGSPVGRYLAAAARLEAGSVHAFKRLRGDLADHGAPRSLCVAALRAERDEVRHARETARLAQAHGVTPRMPADRLRRRRSLLAIAAENVVEGCVRETYGALVAMHQAETAKDPAVARLMRPVATDEIRHAALSWEVARWVNVKLRPKERALVERARRTAILELQAELAREPPPALVETVGLPRATTATRLLGAMLAQLEGRS